MSEPNCPSCGKTVRKLHEDRVHGQLRVWHVGPHVLGDVPCMWPVGGASFVERDQLRARVDELGQALTGLLRECGENDEFFGEDEPQFSARDIRRRLAALAAGAATTEETRDGD